jgi:hypothetical protein
MKGNMNNTSSPLTAFKRAPSLGLSQRENGNLTTNLAEYDQPGVAARVVYHGVGEFLEIEDLSLERVQGLTQEVLENPRYREKARWFQKVIAQTRGLDVAADVIERAFRLPVYPYSLRPNPTKITADRRVLAHTCR